MHVAINFCSSLAGFSLDRRPEVRFESGAQNFKVRNYSVLEKY